ncbi:MAG: phosphatase PAP2 family protein [Deltaproteobacteria bacterium]|nr:phosphatase PAP2 family protein [Deltaproteobacteria bacterium]
MVTRRVSAAASTEEPRGASAGTTRRIFTFGLVPLHLVLVAWTVGLRVDHLLIDAASIGLFYIGPKSARFAQLLLPIWLVGFIYELQPLLLPLRGSVHVEDLYRAELAWFGVESGGERLTPPQLLGRHLSAPLDLLCGVTYLLYLVETFVFAGLLYFKDQERMSTLTLSFLAVNLAGICTYLLYPAAPPWYVDSYGLGPAVLDAAPSAARAARFDALVGVNVFASFYSRNANIFGAVPSLHCAYPMLVLLCSRPLGKGAVAFAAVFAALVGFSAVYLNHHYVIDVVLGVLYALGTFAAVRTVRRYLSAHASVPKGALSHAPG